MKTGDSVRGARDTYTITGLFEDAPTGLVWRARPRKAQEQEVLVAIPISTSDDQAMARGQATVDALKRLAEAGDGATLVDWSATPQSFLVVEAPAGALVTEIAVQSGPLPEAEALSFLRQLADLLQALHTEANAALASSAFEQVRWDSASQRLWLPLWHELALAPDFERQAVDLRHAGVLAHLALLGRPPVTLWGEPVVLDELPRADDTLSRGVWRLLRRLLHPYPDNRLASAAELVAVVDQLLNAWQNDPALLSDTAQEYFDQAGAGAVAMAWQADDIVDILERRDLELPMTFDWLKDDVESFVQRRQPIENALHLARAGSNAAASEQLRQALMPTGDDLTLQRWLALLADLDAHWFDANSAVEQPLHAVVRALESGYLEAVGVALGALTDPPASLAQELVVRTAWRAAVSQAGNAGAAVQGLDATIGALSAIADPDLRTALDRSLGGLVRWRQRAAQVEATNEQAVRIDEARERLRATRQQGQWADAVAELHSALALYPRHAALLEEGFRLGMNCLANHRPEKALDAFAVIAGQASEHRLARLGWRVAQAEVALSTNGPGEDSLARVRLATDHCLHLAQEEPAASDFQAIIESLRMELAAAAATAERMDDATNFAALRDELRRIAAIDAGALGQPNALQAMEAAIQRALAVDEAAALSVLARFSVSAREVVSTNAAAELPVVNSESGTDRIGTVVEKSTGLIRGLFRSSAPMASDPVEPAAPKAPDRTASPLTQHLVKGMISVHFDQVAAALDDVERGAVDKTETLGFTRWTIEAQKVLAEHKRVMEQVAQLAATGAAVQAQQELRKATRADKSRSCWDPKTSSWVPTSHWQFRLSPPSLEQITVDLNSLEPERWARALRLPVSLLERWPGNLRIAALERQGDLDRHQSELRYILANAAGDPVSTLQAFEAWENHRKTLVLCWDAGHSRWAAPGEILADLRMAAAHRSTLLSVSPSAMPQPATANGPLDDLLAALNNNDPQQWEQVVNTPAAQRVGWTDSLLALVNRRSKDLLIHRREMERIFDGFATDPVPVKERLSRWRSTNRLTTNWDSRNNRWVPADDLWQGVERAADTVQAKKWLAAARQHMQNPRLGTVTDATMRGLAFTKADPHILAELETLRQRVEPTPPSRSSSSLGALLEAPLRESETLTQLHIRLSVLAQDETNYSRKFQKMALDLQIWVDEERWLDNCEEQMKTDRLQESSRSHTKDTIRNLEALVRTEAWRPYATMETPAFANVRRRLQAIALPSNRLQQPSLPPPGSLMDLLQASLRESQTLKELQIRLDALAVGEPQHNAQLERLITRLRVWLDEERWLDGIENDSIARKNEQTRNRAQRSSAELQAFIDRDQFWSPFVTKDTLAFANLRRRLQAIAETSNYSSETGSSSPGSLGALLEAPLGESETLTQLHIRLKMLAQEKTQFDHELKKLVLDLEIWVLEERWLDYAEEQKKAGHLQESNKSHAINAIRDLESLIRAEARHPYVTMDTPAFANMHRRLHAIVGPGVPVRQSGSAASTAPTMSASADKASQSTAASNQQQTAASRKTPVKKTSPAQVKEPKPAAQAADVQPAKSPPSKTDGVSSAEDEQFQDQLRKTLRNTNSMTILQARLEALSVVDKEHATELARLVDEIVALRAVENDLDEVLTFSGQPPSAYTVRQAAAVQSRIAALSLPIRPKAINDLEKKARAVQRLASI